MLLGGRLEEDVWCRCLLSWLFIPAHAAFVMRSIVSVLSILLSFSALFTAIYPTMFSFNTATLATLCLAHYSIYYSRFCLVHKSILLLSIPLSILLSFLPCSSFSTTYFLYHSPFFQYYFLFLPCSLLYLFLSFRSILLPFPAVTGPRRHPTWRAMAAQLAGRRHRRKYNAETPLSLVTEPRYRSTHPGTTRDMHAHGAAPV